MKKLLSVMLAALVLLIGQTPPAWAAGQPHPVPDSRGFEKPDRPNGAKNGHPQKVVFHPTRQRAQVQPAVSSPNNMTYHGGPTERTGSTSFAIYWQPSGSYMSPTYQSLINRYFTDTGGSSLYNIATQYYDGGGNITNSSGLGGSWVDTSAYPAGDLTDQQIQQEVTKAITANNWPWQNPNAQFFVFTAKGKNSCYGSLGGCSFSSYCAYHSFFTMTNGSNTASVLYANQPYTGTAASCEVPGGSPNNDLDADSTINVVSHEQMETVTDPHLDAWYDFNGDEIGDKCAWTFGTVDGNGTNVDLNGHPYIVQQEWSNASASCVLSYGPSAANFSIAASPQSQTVAAGSSTTYAVTLSASSGYNASINLSASGLPAGVTAAFSPQPATFISGTATSTLTIGAAQSAAPGNSTLTITGTGTDSAKTIHTATVGLNVQAGVATNACGIQSSLPQQPGANLTIAASGSSAAVLHWVKQGSEAGYCILRATTSGNTFIPGPTAQQSLTWTDPAQPATACYLVLSVTNNVLVGISDALCIVPGNRSGSAPPANFTLGLAKSATASLAWTPPPGATAQTLYAAPASGGAVRTQSLSGTATSGTDATGGATTCYLVAALQNQAALGTSDLLCAIPGQSSAASVNPAQLAKRTQAATAQTEPAAAKAKATAKRDQVTKTS